MPDPTEWLDGWPPQPPASSRPPTPPPPHGPPGGPPGGVASPSARPHQRGARHRTLAGAVVGGGLGLAVELALLAGTQSHIAAQLSCSNQQPYGCLGLAIIAIVALQVLFLTLPWPLLHLAGVRPAWRPALLGVLIQIGMYVLNSTIVEPWHNKAFPVLLPAAIYALAAFATSSDIPRRWRFSAVAVILVGYPLIAGSLTGFTFMPHAIMDRLHL